MTTCDLEAAFEAGIVALAIPANEIQRGADWKVLPHDRSATIIDCADVEHITAKLWSGSVVFRLSSPALKKDLAAHGQKFGALQAWLRNPVGVVAAFGGGGAFRLVGIWVLQVRSLEVDNRWLGEIECRVGIEEI